VQAIVKTFELTDVPVRAGRFVARKNWIVCGSDDFQLRVYSTYFLLGVYLAFENTSMRLLEEKILASMDPKIPNYCADFLLL
jgi:hypothetical protein